ncbi:hypothetical protein VCHA53O466_140011 [Vibrio chagasii]|nr:hypothetical protein VCHA53O466_140011 [Vibrio chagasii]
MTNDTVTGFKVKCFIGFSSGIEVRIRFFLAMKKSPLELARGFRVFSLLA